MHKKLLTRVVIHVYKYIIQYIKEMYHTFDTYDRAQSYVWYQSEFIHDEKEEQDEVFTHGWTWTISTRIA